MLVLKRRTLLAAVVAALLTGFTMVAVLARTHSDVAGALAGSGAAVICLAAALIAYSRWSGRTAFPEPTVRDAARIAFAVVSFAAGVVVTDETFTLTHSRVTETIVAFCVTLIVARMSAVASQSPGLVTLSEVDRTSRSTSLILALTFGAQATLAFRSSDPSEVFVAIQLLVALTYLRKGLPFTRARDLV